MFTRHISGPNDRPAHRQRGKLHAAHRAGRDRRGYWGPNLVRTALATPELRLEWLCDLDIERAQAVLGPRSTIRATSSYEEVLADPAVAAVAIATPAATHFDLVRAALEAGKHVLVEKPLTASVAEGAEAR